MADDASTGETHGDGDEESVWIRDVEYIHGWAEARDAAGEFNAALAAVGVRREDLWASAYTDDRGRGVVRLRGTPLGFRQVASALRRASV